jgi:hypothetical protein
VKKLLQGKDGRYDDGAEDCKMGGNRREQQMVYTKASLGHRVKGEAAAVHGPPPPQSPRSTLPSVFPWPISDNLQVSHLESFPS